ncbi:unnamed protein product [Polarella glacialis]|uniref:SET domain-containing protein n=1 Tax=Polarella glacialis TaxID=89957 RepID=A0A813IQC9_POLGL|nr:unnamed protein product [Polarella glacialis]CAE8736532.1 unnamed protein product [Polarella glacialis]
MDIWEMNCFAHTVHEDVSCLFLAPCLANHSCRPNAIWYFTDFSISFRAIADLAAGDEVTISYLEGEELLAATGQRRAKLLQGGKDFHCTCERCSLLLDSSRGVPCHNCLKGRLFLGADQQAKCCFTCGFRLSPMQEALLLDAERTGELLLDTMEGQ